MSIARVLAVAAVGVLLGILPFPVQPSAQQVVPYTSDGNTVALYHFDEVSGSTVSDASGHVYTGTATNATIASGKWGNSRSFTQSPQGYVSFGSFDLPAAEGTVEMWIKPRPRSSWQNHSHLFVKGIDGHSDGGYTFFMRVWDDGHLDAGRGAYGSGIVYLPTPPGVVTFGNTWQHIAFTWSSSKTQWFVNGALVASGGGMQLGLTGHPVALAKWGALLYPETYYEGEIDELRISTSQPLAPVFTVSGNKILKDGEPFTIKGINRGDLEREITGLWGPGGGAEYSDYDFERIADKWLANTVRIPLNQVYWLHAEMRDDYQLLIKQVVAGALSHNLHVILDLHWSAGGSLDTARAGQYRMPDTWSIQFWREVAHQYRDDSRVFFELFNEPIVYDWNTWRNGSSGSIGPGEYWYRGFEQRADGGQWQAAGMQRLVEAVRVDAGASNLILIGGLDWAFDLSKVLDPRYKLNGENLVFVTHPYDYPGKRRESWDAAFGQVAKAAPVVATEFGQRDCRDDYVKTFLQYASTRGLGFVAWTWHWESTWTPGCDEACNYPTIINSWNGTASTMGQPIQAVMTSQASALRFTKYSPVDIRVTDSQGRRLGPVEFEIPGGDYWEFERSAGDIGAYADILLPEDGLFRVDVLPWVGADPQATYSLNVILDGDTTWLEHDRFVREIPRDAYAFNTLPFASLSGLVSISSGRGAIGVCVEVSDPTGVIQQTNVTGPSGYYFFDSIPNGEYIVTINTPVGYHADQESKALTVHHVPAAVDFALQKLSVAPNQRTRSFWSQQLSKALRPSPPTVGQPGFDLAKGGFGLNETVSRADFARYAGLISQHFNGNRLGPIDEYTVPQPATQMDSLNALLDLLNLKPEAAGEHMLKRLARGDLVALMLNVVSGRLHQADSISRDGNTASQAITYCDMLINDPNCPVGDIPGTYMPWYDRCCELKTYIKACFILGLINVGVPLPAGAIPDEVLNIAFKEDGGQAPLPTEAALLQNYPNPFNAGTTISYTVASESHVTLAIYNLLGQKVVYLADADQAQGAYSVEWNGRDARGKEVASGIYLYRLQVGDLVMSKKMTLLR